MRASWALAAACLGAPVVAASAEGNAPAVRSVPVPAAGRPVDTSHPSRVVGRGTPASCTSAAVVAAVRAGGIIRFSCGPKPVTITMSATAKVVNTSRAGGPRRRRTGDAQRRGPAPHPLHGHVRSGAEVDDVALPGSGHPAARRPEPDVHRRELDRPATSMAAAAARSSTAAAGCGSSTRCSRTTAASATDRTSAAPPSGRCRSTAAFRSTSWAAASPATRAATAPR